MKKTFLLLSAVTIFSFISCAKPENPISSVSNSAEKKYSENDMIKLLKVMPNSSTAEPSARHEITIGWDEWGRASRGCEGWGLCNFSFHYQEKRTTSLDETKYKSNIVTDNKGNTFFTILLSEVPSSDIPKDLLALRIDNDIKYVFGKEIYFIKSGAYYYDKNLGNYGGYKINVN